MSNVKNEKKPKKDKRDRTSLKVGKRVAFESWEGDAFTRIALIDGKETLQLYVPASHKLAKLTAGTTIKVVQ
jgi:hypothetical protein